MIDKDEAPHDIASPGWRISGFQFHGGFARRSLRMSCASCWSSLFARFDRPRIQTPGPAGGAPRSLKTATRFSGV
ncbi:hypothetical protein CW354_13090 [Marinicaulis flavus]|uniref:Uncharacterized protein n=1 Tax=Hyphococcus luteus TaxID=2058213 RepID=A0A2S7K4J3_9PROT|nr:hypothetical protein CW354_13090 [Marinicaulis flavus]